MIARLFTFIMTKPAITFFLIAFISFTALTMAFISEAFLGLEPCILCIYQRWPFAIGIFFGLLGILKRKKPKAVTALLTFSSINFFVNSGIAAYHTGVEQKWWGGLDTCKVIFEEDKAEQSILENIMSAPMASCSDIPWQDPILNLSMANYNIILCFGLAVFCLLSVVMYGKSRPKKRIYR